MARKVDHEARKREIAEKAMRLFSKVGYDNVSLIMIAASSGVSRTALYRYFCSKREVLDAAIQGVLDEIAVECRKVVVSRASTVAKLEGVCHAVTDVMFDHKDFVVAVFDYVIAMVRTDVEMNGAIRAFTSGTRDILAKLVDYGKARGEFPAVLVTARTVDALYSGFESTAMRIALGSEATSDAAKTRISDIIKAIAAWK